MIYLDNAATGGFKPNSVTETVINVIKYLSVNPGRSGHRLSQTGAEFVFSARKRLSAFFDNGDLSRVIFTKNCSEALNTAIYGTISLGGNVVTTVTEHNSVLRPLFTLEKQGKITVTVVKPRENGGVKAKDIENAITDKTYLVIMNHASNVTGTMNDVSGTGELLKDKNILFMVDGAQAAGHVPVKMQSENIDLLCVSGHKGLYGIGGSGALIIKKGVDVTPTFQGGTGTESFNPYQPDCYPERLEYGTLNLPAICSLEEGVRYIENNLDYVSRQLTETTSYLFEKLSEIERIAVYGKPNPFGIVAFSLDGVPSSEVAEILSYKFDVCVRGGFHCAPLMHNFLGTENDGLVRVSLSPHNTRREINALLSALKIISSV